MSLAIIINAVSNLVLTVGFCAFLIFLFGRENSFIHKLKGLNTIFVKVSLSVCTAGALYNLLTLSNPPVSEIVLNFGLAMLFSWAAWFHYWRFVRPLRNSVKGKRKIIKKRATK